MAGAKEDRLFLELAQRRGAVSPEAAAAARDLAERESVPLVDALLAADAIKLEDADAVRRELARLVFECSKCGAQDHREIGEPKTDGKLCSKCGVAASRPSAKLSSPVPRPSTKLTSPSPKPTGKLPEPRPAPKPEPAAAWPPPADALPAWPPREEPSPEREQLTQPFDPNAKTVSTPAGSDERTQAAASAHGTTPAVSPEVAEGQELGGCKIGRKIGQGGMGRVYHAHHTGLDRYMAVKVLDEKLTNRQGFVEQFLVEARTLAKLDHQNVVRVFNVGKDETGRHFIVMELLEGGSVEALWKRRDKKLPVEDAVRIAREAASGLRHAHESGLIHRDVKPGNLMLTKDGRVKVVDFGLAVPTKDDLFVATEIAGTPAYMAPEQADARPLDARCDQYSLGATLYQLLCGKPPFQKKAAIEVLFAQINEEPQAPRELRPEVPAWLERVVLRMMAKSPDDRFPSLEDAEKALEAGEAGASAASAAPAVSEEKRVAKIITVEEISRLEKELASPKAILPRWRPAVVAAAASAAAAVVFLAGPLRAAFGHVDLGREGQAPRAVERVASEAERAKSGEAVELGATIARLDEEIADLGSRPGAERLDKVREELKKSLAAKKAATEDALPKQVAALVKAGRFAEAFDIADPASSTIAPLALSALAEELRKKVAEALAKERGAVYVPAGPYRSGADGHEARTAAFYLDRTEVTNAAWEVAVKARGLAPPPSWPDGKLPQDQAERPVVGVTFEEARLYAKSCGKRLPTSDEWEKAARGAGDDRAFPWGPRFEPGRANVLDGGSGSLEDVTARPGDVSPYGALGLAGNALEWVEGAKGALVAGGGFRSLARTASVWARFALDPTERHPAVGFRCAADVEPRASR